MPSPFDSINGALTVGRYRVGSTIARLTPAVVAHGLTSMIAPTIAIGLRDKRAMMERHLKRIDPTMGRAALRRASQGAIDSYMRYYVESFRLPDLSKDYVNRMFACDGFEHIEAGLERGNGVILALPHLGGWEWAGRWMADRGHRMTVIVEPLQPPELFEWFAKLRNNLGMNVVPLGPSAAPAVLRALKSNQIVCLLCDRDIQGGGIEVDFFGESTTLPGGPAMLGIRADSVVLPTAVYFTPRVDGHHAIIRPPIDLRRTDSLREDVRRSTQDLAHELEFLIRRAPEQWHMFQPNWPSDPGYGDRLKV